MIGAHCLAISDFAGARRGFERAKALASEAGDRESATMNDGYLALTGLLEDESGAAARLTTVLAELGERAKFEHGAFYAQQLETALRVLGAGRTL